MSPVTFAEARSAASTSTSSMSKCTEYRNGVRTVHCHREPTLKSVPSKPTSQGHQCAYSSTRVSADHTSSAGAANAYRRSDWMLICLPASHVDGGRTASRQGPRTESSGDQHDLARGPAAGQRAVRVGGVGERESVDDRRPDTGLESLDGEFGEALDTARPGEQSRPDRRADGDAAGEQVSGVEWHRRPGAVPEQDHSATRPDQLERSSADRPADSIEGDRDASFAESGSHDVGPAVDEIVRDDARTQRSGEVEFCVTTGDTDD